MKSKLLKKRLGVLLAAAIIAVVGAYSMPPMPQDIAYHDFADSRALFGIPGFGNVIGNLAFAVVGICGIMAVMKRWPHRHGAEFKLWLVFFAGVFMVAFGSGYYHLAPDNHRLVWDRLPMTIAFMSLLSIVVMERVDEKWGAWLFLPFLAIGAGSVFYWDYTESLGRGDLRPYGLVQFLPMLAIFMMIAMFPPRYPGSTRYMFFTLGWYVLGKLLEHFDRQVFDALGGMVSGHTLKHLAAAAGVACMVGYVRAESGRAPQA